MDLFGETTSDWTIAEIAFSLDVPTSTVHRTVRELVGAAVLEQSHLRKELAIARRCGYVMSRGQVDPGLAIRE